MARSDAARQAEAFETDAVRFPDERGEILFEAIAAWRRAGRPDRARELVDRLVDGGGDDGRYARAERIEMFADDGDWGAARREAEILARDPELEVTHCEMVAETLAEKGRLDEALAWYDRGIVRLDDDEWARLRVPGARHTMAMHLLYRRRLVREGLGHPEDVADMLVVPPPGLRPEPALPHGDEAVVVTRPPGRNEPCPCGSGVKHKKCCGRPG